ncbi:MAG: SDR family oxidoreductase [Luteolibacter sp.]
MSFYRNKTILITGASSGIGEALAHELANEGANLILTARRTDKLSALAEHLIPRHGINAYVIPEDLTSPEGPARLYEKIKVLNLRVDILINNAGLGSWHDFASSDPSVIDQIIGVNIRSLVQLSRLFLPSLLERKTGGIINIGSTASFIPVPGLSVYAASKAFVLSFSEALWGEYHDKGIHVLALCPGNTTTEFDQVANTRLEGIRYDTAERVAKETLNAFEQRKIHHIVGTDNRISSAILPRFLPRLAVIRLVSSILKRKADKSSRP